MRTDAYDSWMDSSGRSFDPTKEPPRPSAPLVDYRLARRAALTQLRQGFIGVTDVCDAHPELLRAAKNIGEPLEAPCPICSHTSLKLVRYVFGDVLKHDNGRVVYPREWLGELAARHETFTCYVVECCIDCSWNHLVRAFQVGTKWSRGSTPVGEARRRRL